MALNQTYLTGYFVLEVRVESQIVLYYQGAPKAEDIILAV